MTELFIPIYVGISIAMLAVGAVCGYAWGHHLGMLESKPVSRETT